MKKFKFRLERLLRLRRHVERDWELRLAEAAGRCSRVENYIQECMQEKEACPLFPQGNELLSAAGILQNEAYHYRLTQQIGEAEELLAQENQRREEINAAYIAASRERKVIEKLREKQSREYYKAGFREEGKILDEVASFMTRPGREEE
jgi:flagellar FliJ protein